MYKAFKSKYPNVELQFDAPPNPADFGKRREGFQAYMQALERWENSCKEIIEHTIQE